jgi:hypothetical protein
VASYSDFARQLYTAILERIPEELRPAKHA